MKKRRSHGAPVCIGAVLLTFGIHIGCAHRSVVDQRWPDDLITTSERSEYRATETHAEIVAILDRIAERSPLAQRATMGQSFEGRALPLLIIADPPVHSALEAQRSGKLIVYLQGTIHGGEVCGKPALIQLARELALNPDARERAWLDDMVIVMCPIFNPDGNDRIKPGNRGEAQKDPEQGMGQRPNALGLNLNRDHMKLDSPEAQAVARFLTDWNPHLTMDLHTTNGSLHQYALTYAAPQNPAGHPAPIEFVRDRMLPSVSASLEARTGLKTFFYGNFDKDHTVWRTYSHQPRFGAPYRGLRNRMSILSEAYAYDTYRQRVDSTREFVRECLNYAHAHKDEIAALLDLAERATVSAPKGDDGAEIGIRYEITAFDEPATILGYEQSQNAAGEPAGALRPRVYTVKHEANVVPTLSVKRPYAYLIPASCETALEKLRQHGVTVERLGERFPDDVEQYIIQSIERSERLYEGRHLTTVEAVARRLQESPDLKELAASEAAWWVAPMDQPLANLAIYLLEPQSDDGLVRWDIINDLEVGGEFPILRVMSPREQWPITSNGP